MLRCIGFRNVPSYERRVPVLAYWENNKAVVGMQYRINRLVTRNGAGYTLKVHILQWKG